jgi:replication factor C subunit 1
MSKKAVLLSGPPGIGKTSSAHIIARCGDRQPPVLLLMDVTAAVSHAAASPRITPHHPHNTSFLPACYLCATCSELGYHVVEVNASDARGKADSKLTAGIGGKLANTVREMVTSTALSAPGGAQRLQVLVMDEVDGMSGAGGC